MEDLEEHYENLAEKAERRLKIKKALEEAKKAMMATGRLIKALSVASRIFYSLAMFSLVASVITAPAWGKFLVGYLIFMQVKGELDLYISSFSRKEISELINAYLRAK